MSFSSFKRTIEQGDTVILYLNSSSMHAFEVTPTIMNKAGIAVNNVFQTKYGALRVIDLVGKEFGKRIQLTRGWAYVLHPTPELWTLTLPHRTQIIYTPDISMIVMQLDIKPGSIVVESGTGSGSLTHALARTVRPNGSVYSYDFHEQRVAIAKKEFSEHGLDGIVYVEQRDVCEFGFSKEHDGKVDAVFLDLPHPWLVIPHAINSFKKCGGRICSFSPCMEQVQRTCETLGKHGFLEITTMECLLREYMVKPNEFTVVSVDHKESGDESSKVLHAWEERGVGSTKHIITEKKSIITSSAKFSLPGHTGYLTLATLPPVWARRLRQETESNPASSPKANLNS